MLCLVHYVIHRQGSVVNMALKGIKIFIQILVLIVNAHKTLFQYDVWRAFL